MSVPSDFAARVAEFPAALRALIEAELSAGNAIVEIASCFPAPPAGAYVKLARPVTTRPHHSAAEIDFYDRNSSLYSGEWTDQRRFFFVLEPPHPVEQEPDLTPVPARPAHVTSSVPTARPSMRDSQAASIKSATQEAVSLAAPTSSVLDRFRRSMVIDYEKWHDGIGYDVSLIKEANAPERAAIESLLLSRGINDWRDVEALAALGTERANRALQQAMRTGKADVRAAVLRHAPGVVSEETKVAFLTQALRTAQFYGGLTQVLDEVAAFHPPQVVAELFRGALERRGEIAAHFAAMLLFIHGQAKEPFDWTHRPFFLRFDTSTRAERETVFRELCARVGVSPEFYLPAS